MDGEPPKEEKKVEQINIKVVSQDGGEVAFKIKKTTQMKKVMVILVNVHFSLFQTRKHMLQRLEKQ